MSTPARGHVVTLPPARDVYTARAKRIGERVLLWNLDGNAFAAALLSHAVEGWLLDNRDRLEDAALDDLAARLDPTHPRQREDARCSWTTT